MKTIDLDWLLEQALQVVKHVEKLQQEFPRAISKEAQECARKLLEQANNNVCESETLLDEARYVLDCDYNERIVGKALSN